MEGSSLGGGGRKASLEFRLAGGISIDQKFSKSPSQLESVLNNCILHTRHFVYTNVPRQKSMFRDII